MNGLEDLQEQEKYCIAKFKARATRLMAADPTLSFQIAIAKAFEGMPRVLAEYQSVRLRLGQAGIRSLPIKP